MTDAAAQAGRAELPFIKLKIVVGAAFVGMLAGMGIAAIDYPWHTFGGPTHDDTRRGATATAAPASGAPAAAPRPPAAERPSSERLIAQAKPVVRQAKKRRQAPPPIDSPVASTAVPAEAATASSLDSKYERRANAECARGIQGFLCRENIRWRLCDGRWNDGSDPGATRCGVGKTEHGLSPG